MGYLVHWRRGRCRWGEAGEQREARWESKTQPKSMVSDGNSDIEDDVVCVVKSWEGRQIVDVRCIGEYTEKSPKPKE